MLAPSPRPSSTSSMLSDGSPQEEYLPSLAADHYSTHTYLGLDHFVDFGAESHLGPEPSTDLVGSFPNVDLHTGWGSPSHYANSLGLVGTPPPSLANTTYAHTGQPYHDSYYLENLYGYPPASLSPHHSASVAVATRDVPRIRIETDMPTSFNAAVAQDPRSPFQRSPSALLSSSPYSNSSPSSTASAPPITPHSPFTSVPHIHTPYSHSSTPSAAYISPGTISPQLLDQHDAFGPPALPKSKSEEPVRVLEFAEEIGHPFCTPLVPQPDYKPHTQSDRRRYVEQAELEGPIFFWTLFTDGSGRTFKTLGIPLSDAFNSRFVDLMDRDDPMFQERGPSVSIRINWPGYAPWSRQIPTRDFRSPPQPVTRSKLARNVAKTILRFIQEMDGRPMDDNAQEAWRVGERHIQLGDLMLVGLQHVSMGSWQAHIRLMRPL